jgi:hypothetical protein
MVGTCSSVYSRLSREGGTTVASAYPATNTALTSDGCTGRCIENVRHRRRRTGRRLLRLGHRPNDVDDHDRGREEGAREIARGQRTGEGISAPESQ